MSSPADSRRRPRSEIEGDDDADILRRSQSSTPSSSNSPKRARVNGYQNESQPESSIPRQCRSNMYDDVDLEEDSNTSEAGASDFQPGAIVRVKLTNFVTYESAEFFPGPNLNMVIGPNGTGKSSLVCAICLGLGWGPSHLGRAQQIGEFVKHNTSSAQVEIELQRRPEEPRNHVVRLKIIKDGNIREFWLDDRKTSLKAVQTLTRGFNIQVDNLCQFLPQDKVSEFAALSPIELLQQTQRAAAPEEMLEQHESLKQLRKEEKSLDNQLERDKENLRTRESRQEGLRVEVQQLEERNQILENVMVLRKTVPFIEYRFARNQHIAFKNRKKEAQRCLRSLEAELEPTLQSITRKENYVGGITAAVRDRRNAVDVAEKDANILIKTIESIQEDIQDKVSKIDSEKKEEAKRRNELNKVQRNITALRARLNDEPIIFDSSEWNERIRAKEHQIKDIKTEIAATDPEKQELLQRGRLLKANIQDAKNELAAFDTQEGQQSVRLKNASEETAAAWQWVQENRDKFEEEVYGPPLISCSIKEPKYADAIESIFSKGDFLTITAQTEADFQILNEKLYGEKKYAVFPIKRSDGSGLNEHPILTAEELRRLGFDGWASDFVDGPPAVLSMLGSKLTKTAIRHREIGDRELDLITEAGKLNHFVAGSHSYGITRRAEFGPNAVSTRTGTVYPANYWTDQPVDTSGKLEIQSRIDSTEAEFEALKVRMSIIKTKQQDFQSRITELLPAVDELKKAKNELQKAQGEQAALPAKIEREEEALKEKQLASTERRDRIKALKFQIDADGIKKAQKALDYKECVSAIRDRHGELLEAEIMLIEAKSDVASLKERNQDIDQRLAEERQKAEDAEAESARAQAVARRAIAICQTLSSDPENAPYLDRFKDVPDDKTVEDLEHDIAAEESKLEFTNANNPNAIRDFEKFGAEVERLKTKVSDAEEKLETISENITEVRGIWEPALDSLIERISEAFSYNFEQIGCAGEVGVHKDEDFDLWAIQIKVKFREGEDLQLLDQHRQSGGERSVSTIFYLMSLQRMARAPFRVVDEINQGMDPRNERMVHERMVDIACKENTSQYFLITPKLLTGLRYDKRMKVLCIYSGEHMPDNHKKLDISKILGMRRAIVAAG
ncbi:Structural maintenance of chromosomes protein 5 [Lachnellula cervina]|uniref:Structural maintenance of chromosomes protein 5 n=1 Tax=Lachnellula cervina TaxID=1316786 RepID=A0A7D8YZI3_9HELO|nr:Structural maintenance of chromosomes protein 5 [Lachnellula cervina]